jgi:hypothetical protein
MHLYLNYKLYNLQKPNCKKNIKMLKSKIGKIIKEVNPKFKKALKEVLWNFKVNLWDKNKEHNSLNCRRIN